MCERSVIFLKPHRSLEKGVGNHFSRGYDMLGTVRRMKATLFNAPGEIECNMFAKVCLTLLSIRCGGVYEKKVKPSFKYKKINS